GVATAAAVGTAVGNSVSRPAPPPTTTIAVGTIVPALPGGCVTERVNNITYHQCGGVYYRPYYQGTTLGYQISRPSGAAFSGPAGAAPLPSLPSSPLHHHLRQASAPCCAAWRAPPRGPGRC